jgi:hypothetical protein
MKKERVVRNTQFLYPEMIQVDGKSFCFAVCDNVILLSVYDSLHVTINKAIQPQPLKITNYTSGSERFKYRACLAEIITNEGVKMRGRLNITKQFKIRKGTEVTQAYLEKIVSQEILSGRWDNE